jgi:hypothetical protein
VTRRRMLFSGWLAMTSAMLTIPWLILSLALAGNRGVMVKVVEAVMLVDGAALTVYLLLTLQRLLHEGYSFILADPPIKQLIRVNVIAAGVSILGLAIPTLESSLGTFGLVVVVILGIFQIILGIRLLRLSADFQGLWRPYCYLNIGTGICLAAIILVPVGMITGAIADVMLGTIFFQVAAAMKNAAA